MRRLCALAVCLLAILAAPPNLCWTWGQEAPPAAEATATPPSAASTEAPAAAPVAAAEATPEAPPAPAAPAFSSEELAYSLDNMILFVAAVLVLFMQSGFALVEAGLNASKNAVNIFFKNFMDMAIGTLLFFVVGYGIMYPGADDKAHIIPNVLGFAQVGIADADPTPGPATLHPQVDFLFQAAFCATAATIVSGAVAGRIKFSAYLIYTVVISALVYPVSGMWHWGKGFLADMGFIDFAGSVIVHAVGGAAALMGAIALGPRIGRYVNGKPRPMPGHNIPFAALGVFILWIGWFGFNPGSQLAFTGGANVKTVMLVAVNTTLAGSMGAVVSMFVSWIMFKKPDLTMALNGALAGLVGITANCHIVTNVESLMIGGIAGVIVVFAVLLLDKLCIDDPVGAVPVHFCCGIWGGIATGIFGEGAVLKTQLIGVGAMVGWSLVISGITFFLLKAIGLLRVDAEEEIAGLDICEHGMYAYPAALVAASSTEAMGGGSAGSVGGAPIGGVSVAAH